MRTFKFLMQSFLFILLLLPFFGSAQKQDIYIKLTTGSGQMIKGSSMTRGYERWIPARVLSNSGENNTRLSFRMDIGAASSTLKNVMTNREALVTGEVHVLQPFGLDRRWQPVTTIKMEHIMVEGCNEITDEAGVLVTEVILTATRIGWTQYQYSKSGQASISGKYGYDAETGGSWTNF